MKKYWFVGGPWNGQHYQIPDGHNSWVVPVTKRAPTSVFDEPGMPDPPEYRVLYWRKPLLFGDRVIDVFMPQGMTEIEAVTTLAGIAYQYFVDTFGRTM